MKAVVASRHPLLLEGIRATLTDLDFLQIVDDASDVSGVLSAVANHSPQLLILDLDVSRQPHPEIIRPARGFQPRLKVLILTAVAEESELRQVMVEPIDGWLLKSESTANVLQALRCLHQGHSWFSQEIANRLLSIRTGRVPSFPSFSPREWDILRLLGAGYSNQDISKSLCLAVQSVSNCLRGIYAKLEVRNRTEAALWARRQREESRGFTVRRGRQA